MREGDPKFVWVRDKNKTVMKAEILKCREQEGAVEHYIHLVGKDKRFDRWIPERCIGGYCSGERKPRASGHRTRRYTQCLKEDNGISGIVDPAALELEEAHRERTKIKNIEDVVLGRYRMDCWYFSPYPEEVCGKRLYVCGRCLGYMKQEESYAEHVAACVQECPGRTVYRKDGVTVREVSGAGSKTFCQRLCLFGKLFLDHKVTFFDVESFVFYVLYEGDGGTEQIAGFFSKEREKGNVYNLSCIVVLPPYQRKGYGRFLISLSYELSRAEGIRGTPERPLSDLGLLTYRKFWAQEVLSVLCTENGPRTIEGIAKQTGIYEEDVFDTLEWLHLFRLCRDRKTLLLSADKVSEASGRFLPTKGCLFDRAFLIRSPEESGSCQ
ncbi:MAG: histone acetyltransferase ESA1-like [Amphiamblys sp. WSBS2006]|nr:MAG: histone acetyltransferase ESA1-like [Amphiamblys sp. WSBS2006]